VHGVDVSEWHGEHLLNPCLRDGTSTRGMKQFFFRLKDDYSGFDETDFSTRTDRACEAAGGKQRKVVPRDRYYDDRFLSSLCLFYLKENSELWGAFIKAQDGFLNNAIHHVVLLSPFYPPLLSSNDLECISFLHSSLCSYVPNAYWVILRPAKLYLKDFNVLRRFRFEIHLFSTFLIYENRRLLVRRHPSWRAPFAYQNIPCQ